MSPLLGISPPTVFAALQKERTNEREISYIQGFYSSERFLIEERQRDTVDSLGEGRGSSVGFLIKKKREKKNSENLRRRSLLIKVFVRGH